MGIRIEMAVFVSSLIRGVCSNSKANAGRVLDHKAATMHSISSKAETEEAFPTRDQRTLPC